jgi:DNA ligase-1
VNKGFKPMLASPADLDTLRYPLLASPKLDGIRAMVRGGRLVSRKLLDIPNKEIFQTLTRPEFDGLDGELIVGPATAKDVYNKTVSFVMAQDKIGAEFTYHIFDRTDLAGPFKLRFESLEAVIQHERVRVHQHQHIANRDELDAYEAEHVGLGYEGIMLRAIDGPYKHGRSTTKEQILLKVKRFEDSEAEIIGIEEEMFNGNEAGRDELGRTKRSTAKAGKVGKGTMGALVVRDIHTKVEFNIGTGFTAAQRALDWKIGSIHKYKFFPVGVKVAPRHPVYLGPRHGHDL